MKIKIFILCAMFRLCLCFPGERAFVAPDFSLENFEKNSKITVYSLFSFDFDSKKEITSGLKIDMPFFSMKSYYKNEENLSNFGFKVFSEKIVKWLPVNFYAGNLSISGEISKLFNPNLSASSSPFSSSAPSLYGLKANLPSASSFTKPFASGFSFGLEKQIFALKKIKISFFYIPEILDSANCVLPSSNQSFFGNFYFQLAPQKSKFLNLTASITAGQFFYEENNFSQWFSSEKSYFHEDYFWGINSSLLLKYKKLNVLFSAFFYESPQNDYLSVFRLASSFENRKIKINLEAFFNNNQNLISGNGTKLKKSFQLKSGFQKKSIIATNAEPIFFKYGFTFFDGINFSDYCNSIKSSAGIQFSASLWALSFISAFNSEIYPAQNHDSFFDFTSADFSAKNIWYFQKIKPEISAKISLKPAENYSKWTVNQKYSLKLNFSRPVNFSIPLNFSFSSVNANLSSWKISSSCQFNIFWKKINWSAKISAEFSGT